MHTAQNPDIDDLPTSAQLWRSTAIAAAAAAALLVAVVWPAEYGIDPTGIGGVLGLTEMGQIKSQLAAEAEADRQHADPAPQPQSALPADRFATLAALLVGTAQAQDAPAPAAAWQDEITLVLAPGQGTEVKLVMVQGAAASFDWRVEGGAVNFDLHGDGGGRETSYEKGRNVPGAAGTLTAAFTGSHGWFWRNRGQAPVTLTLRVRGDYSAIKRYE